MLPNTMNVYGEEWATAQYSGLPSYLLGSGESSGRYRITVGAKPRLVSAAHPADDTGPVPASSRRGRGAASI